LRTTIRVFLRTEEKKRESSKQKEAKESSTAPIAPVLPTSTAEARVDASTEKAASPAPELQQSETPVAEQKQEDVPPQADERMAEQDTSSLVQDMQNQNVEVMSMLQ
jgi:hypothetical protein